LGGEATSSFETVWLTLLSLQDFACNGTIVQSEELGEVIQLQGDQRNKVFEFLSKTLGMKANAIKVHGF